MNGSESFVLNTLSSDAFVLTSKVLLRYLHNSDAALLLSELISLYRYHYQNQTLVFPNMIPVPYKQIEYNVGLSKYKISSALNHLEDLGIIFTKNQGYPQVKHVEIHFDIVADILNEDTRLKEEKKEASKDFYETLNKGLLEETIDETIFGNMNKNLVGVIKEVAEVCKGLKMEPKFSNKNIWPLQQMTRKKTFNLDLWLYTWTLKSQDTFQEVLDCIAKENYA